MQTYTGEFTALTTALFWAFTSIFFTLAGKRVGSQIVNRVRLLIAAVCLTLVHWVLQGAPFPIGVSPRSLSLLALSALVGLVLGDGLLFYAFTQIGARLSMLLMALAPVIGTLLAWIFLQETLGNNEIIAILITVGGIAWVVIEHNGRAQEKSAPRHYVIGILCGVGAATGQAAGLVLTKLAIGSDFPAVSASLIRVLSATLVIWVIALIQKQARSSFSALSDRRGLMYITGGALVGPVIGMTLSLVAIQFSEIGIASTLMAISPILLLPLGHWIFKEHISKGAILGTAIAISGVAMIFLQ